MKIIAYYKPKNSKSYNKLDLDLLKIPEKNTLFELNGIYYKVKKVRRNILYHIYLDENTDKDIKNTKQKNKTNK